MGDVAALVQRSRRTLDALSYGVSQLGNQWDEAGKDVDNAEATRPAAGSDGGSAATDADRDRDALFGHIRQLIEHSYGMGAVSPPAHHALTVLPHHRARVGTRLTLGREYDPGPAGCQSLRADSNTRATATKAHTTPSSTLPVISAVI